MCASRCVTSIPAASARSICARSSISTCSGFARASVSRVGARQTSLVVDQRGHRLRAGHRSPAVAGPLGVEREVDAEIEPGDRARELGRLGESRARHHHAAAGGGPARSASKRALRSRRGTCRCRRSARSRRVRPRAKPSLLASVAAMLPPARLPVTAGRFYPARRCPDSISKPPRAPRARRPTWRAREILSRFRSVAVEPKLDGSPVTEADRAAERVIRAHLRAGLPGVRDRRRGVRRGRQRARDRAG